MFAGGLSGSTEQSRFDGVNRRLGPSRATRGVDLPDHRAVHSRSSKGLLQRPCSSRAMTRCPHLIISPNRARRSPAATPTFDTAELPARGVQALRSPRIAAFGVDRSRDQRERNHSRLGHGSRSHISTLDERDECFCGILHRAGRRGQPGCREGDCRIRCQRRCCSAEDVVASDGSVAAMRTSSGTGLVGVQAEQSCASPAAPAWPVRHRHRSPGRNALPVHSPRSCTRAGACDQHPPGPSTGCRSSGWSDGGAGA